MNTAKDEVKALAALMSFPRDGMRAHRHVRHVHSPRGFHPCAHVRSIPAGPPPGMPSTPRTEPTVIAGRMALSRHHCPRVAMSVRCTIANQSPHGKQSLEKRGEM